jgi:outer membrane protein assembly factor BamB
MSSGLRTSLKGGASAVAGLATPFRPDSAPQPTTFGRKKKATALSASDLLFSGGREGFFYALDARTGALLWKFIVGGQVQSGPMTYSAGGRQYVAVAAGNSIFAFALRQ